MHECDEPQRQTQLAIALLTVADYLEDPEAISAAIDIARTIADSNLVEVECYSVYDLAVLLKVEGFSSTIRNLLSCSDTAPALEHDDELDALLNAPEPESPTQPERTRKPKMPAAKRVLNWAPVDIAAIGSLLEEI